MNKPKLMDDREKWTDGVLKSLEGIKRATPKNDLFDSIISEIPENRTISIMYLGWVAAAACLIILLNAYVLKLQIESVQDSTRDEENQISLLTDYTF
ncbi:hypothetical protein [Ulvibacterium marinum]|uniref:Uncharacterized protein n=1 Tax=Ulvibacterium marinum TaxID=2419782 RepID=A0A3B0C3X4_9FLAO|nr:hypothetical protein [Ulvibacterium marinum]RKN77946.1 hypothetical protein D7Z94_22265 [Ulvibacterium marinum]